MTREQALRLWQTAPLVAEALADVGPDLVHTFIHRVSLLKQVALRAPGQPDWAARLSELAEHRTTGSGLPGPQQAALFEQYGSVVRTLASRFPLLLLLDDFQWADAGSIHLLFHLGRQLGGSRILVVCAYRPEEVSIGRDGGRHPLEPVIHELQRDYGDIAVHLGQSESQEFVEALLDSEPNRLGSAFRQMLSRQTHGHPLFTIELLRGLQERGDLVLDHAGNWVEGTELDWDTLPARVEAVIAERISRLTGPLQTALRVASVEGESFTAEVLARVRGVAEQRILNSLSGELDRKHRLIRAQSIQRVGGQLISSYRFRHILTQRYLYGSLDDVQRVYLHEQVGATLEALYRAQGQEAAVAVQLALHFERARRTDKAIHYLHQAGDRAQQLSAYTEATTLLTRGLGLLSTMPDSPERLRQELGLLISLGIASKSNLPGPQGEEAFKKARQICYQTGDKTLLGRVLGELLIFPYVRGEHARAREIGEEALSLALETGDALLIAVAHWHLGFVCFAMGEFARARAHLGEMIAFYEPQQHHHPLIVVSGSDAGVSALAYDACCLWCLGYPDQALARSQDALALARAQGHAFSQADVVCYGGCVLHSMGRDPQKLEEAAEELVRLSRGMGFSSFLGTGTTYWGVALTMRGQHSEGIQQIGEGMSKRESVDARCNASGVLSALAEAQARTGHLPQALATLDEALSLVVETGERYCEAEIHRIHAELLLARGQEAGAEESLHEAIRVARHQQARSWELRAATNLARLWQAQGRVEQARELVYPLYAWFTEGWDTPDLREAKALLDELGGAG
jgi:predicted ATPase